MTESKHTPGISSLLTSMEKSKCKGLYYRANVSHCKTISGFGMFVRLSKLKRLSCEGCKCCEWENDYLGEVDNNWPVVNIEKCADGKIYKLIIVNESTDYETGIVDGWDLALVEREEAGDES